VDTIALRPVDGVQVTTLMDNSSDVLLPDEGGLVRRWGLIGSAGPLPVIPNGPPDTFEAIVFSHGHFDHVMGLDGVARRLGRSNLPVLLHPDFWSRRRIVTPGAVFELPTPSRQAIEGAGFVIIEDRQPSFLLDGELLVTGEGDRTTDFETGMPSTHQAWRDGSWSPDQVVHDDQAVVLHIRDKGLVVLTGCDIPESSTSSATRSDSPASTRCTRCSAVSTSATATSSR
jgi:7,8-dihydropterin-6-yl-methyl-4-(beta-D-ribofuranosyl)aminobenzene 5'-phosphate synthase